MVTIRESGLRVHKWENVYYVRFGALTIAIISEVFWTVTPCILVDLLEIS